MTDLLRLLFTGPQPVGYLLAIPAVCVPLFVALGIASRRPPVGRMSDRWLDEHREADQ